MAWVLKGEGVWMVEDGKLVLGGVWGPWSLEGRGFGGLESGAVGPGGAPGEAAGSGCFVRWTSYQSPKHRPNDGSRTLKYQKLSKL